jgi:hypothetical protein
VNSAEEILDHRLPCRGNDRRLSDEQADPDNDEAEMAQLMTIELVIGSPRSPSSTSLYGLGDTAAASEASMMPPITSPERYNCFFPMEKTRSLCLKKGNGWIVFREASTLECFFCSRHFGYKLRMKLVVVCEEPVNRVMPASPGPSGPGLCPWIEPVNRSRQSTCGNIKIFTLYIKKKFFI